MKVAADRAMLRFVNGLSLLVDGSATPRGNTPSEVLLERGKLRVLRYRPKSADDEVEDRRFPVPILLVPPLMVRPYIYDLRPEHSLVRHLRRAGFEVTLVDFGVPEREDAHIRLDDYVLDFLPTAVEAVRKATGAEDISMMGWCMGAIFSLMYAAAHHDRHVRNIVSIAAPIDFTKMGMISVMTQHAQGQVNFMADKLGNIPGYFSAASLKMLAPLKSVTRYADLFLNLWNDEYVKGFDAMNKWSNDFIPYPGEAFKQFFNDFLKENRLIQNRVTMGDKHVDLADLDVSLLAFGGKEDVIAGPGSVRAIMEIVGQRQPRRDHQLVEVGGGHIGVISGGSAPEKVWQPSIDWLRPRSLKERARAAS
jgi:polyhydroxyalkanoate synthase